MSSGDWLSKGISTSQTSAWDAFVGTRAPWRERTSTKWTHWKAEEATDLGTAARLGDDAGMDAAAHEWLREWDVPEASSDVEREGDADSEPRGVGIDVDDAQVTGKRDHAHAAAIAAKRGDDARANRAWDDARRASDDEDGVREVAFEFLVGNFVEEQLNHELEEEGEALAAGAVAPIGSAVKAVHTNAQCLGEKQCVLRGCIG